MWALVWLEPRIYHAAPLGADLRSERHMSPRAPRLYMHVVKLRRRGGYSAGDEPLELELISDRRVGGGVLGRGRGRGRGRRGRPG